MTGTLGKKGAALSLLLCLAAMGGCQRQPKGDTGKTYTPDSKPDNKAGGGGASGASGGQSDAGPLNSPADTTNGQPSPASDAGSSSATRGQVVSEPGAPVEPKKQKPSQPKPEAPPGH